MTLPLQGVRVLDLSRLLPGPYCSQLLADFGADVVKVEDVDRGDYLRDFPPCGERWSVLYDSVNRNKCSITIDLKQEAGKEVLRALVRQYDVLLEGFRPGVMDKLGLGYESLREINPRLIYCAITGYGQDGPYKLQGGHDINYLSFAGITGLFGEQDGKPVTGDIQIADIGGGALMAVIGILLALQARSVTGRGQFCDISMLDGVVSWLPFILAKFGAGEKPVRGTGLLGGSYACYQVYPTADGRYVSLGALEEKFWEGFCRLTGHGDYIDRQMDPAAQPEMIRALQEMFRQKSQADWLEFFAGKDICLSPVNDLAQVLEDPQIRHRRMIVPMPGENSTLQLTGSPIKLSDTPGLIQPGSPAQGEHTRQILEEIGYTDTALAELTRQKVI